MSVLTDLSISYESLPGEPSFFMTSQQATPVQYEIPQTALSMPYITHMPKARRDSMDISPKVTTNTTTRHTPKLASHFASNFDVTPSISTRHAIKRSVPEHPKQALVQDSDMTKIITEFVEGIKSSVKAQVTEPSRTTAPTSRGMFNEFERASLLSYMQRRQFS